MDIESLYSIVKPDEKLSFEDIYCISKKDDDFEMNSSRYTYIYLFSTVGLPSDKEYSIVNIRQNRVTISRRAWRGIKVSFILNPSSTLFQIYLNTLRRLIDLGVKEFNLEFVKSKDLEILNFPNPNPDQIMRLETIQQRLSFASSKS